MFRLFAPHALNGQKPIKQHALKGQKPIKQHALKGQKLLAQGSALGYFVRNLVALKGQKLYILQRIIKLY